MVFGTINDDVTKSGQALTVFHKKLSDIISDIQTLGLKNGLSGILGNSKISLINDGDMDRVNEYFSLIDNGIDKNTAFQSSLNGASSATKQIATSSSSAAAAQQNMAFAVNKVTIAEMAAAIGAKTLSVALNTVATFGVSLLVSKLIEFISNCITATEKAKEAAVALRNSGHEAVKNFSKEKESLDDLMQKYIELSTSTKDISTIKTELCNIQDELNDKYDAETKGIDIVNGKLSEEIENYRQLKYEQAEAFVYNKENENRYKQAMESLNGTGDISNPRLLKRNTYTTIQIEEGLPKEVLTAWNDANLNMGASLKSLTSNEIKLSVFGELAKQRDTWLEMANIYKNIDGYSEDIYNQLMQQYEVTKQKYEIDKADADFYEQQKLYLNNFDISDETLSNFNSLIEQATELNQIVQSDETVAKRYAASQELESLKNEIYQVAGANSVLKDEANAIFSAFETGASNAIISTADLEKSFYESLDNVHKDSMKNIELIENAMQTLAEGKYVSWDDFWDISEIDTEDAIFRPEQIGDELKIDIQQLQQTKDNYIKPIIESLKEENQAIKDQIESTNGVVNGLQDQLEYELLILDAQIKQGVNSTGEENLIEDQKQKIQEIRDKIKSCYEQMDLNDLLIKRYNSHLGNTVDLVEVWKKKIESLQEKAEKYADAMVKQIDNVISNHESEKDVLNKQKTALEEQLDVLEQQQEEIENTIEKYKELVDVVGDVVDEEKDFLKKQQESEEQAIQDKIDAMKETRENQEDEISLVEKELELKQKLADLEKAKNTKVRTYSSDRGWHYDVDKEAVTNAQNEADKAQKDYDKAVDDKSFNDQIDALEKQKETVTKNYEEQIEAYEEYFKAWQDILDEETKAENERVANEILGSDWREKIKNKDTSILNKYKSNFQSYNQQLKSLVDNEISNLKLSIKAKEDEIKAKEQQIQSWRDYKTQVETSISDIKNQYDDYSNILDNVALTEESNFHDREVAFWNFKENYNSILNEIIEMQRELDSCSEDVMERSFDRLGNMIETFDEWTERWKNTIQTQDELHMWNSASGAANLSYAKGGVADYTGLAAVHGEKQRSEVVFNAAQAKQLYDMVMKGEFADLSAAKAAEGFTSVLKSIESAHTFNKNINNTNNSNTSSVVIQHMDINGVQNPAEFARAFESQMDQYWKVKLMESKVNR